MKILITKNDHIHYDKVGEIVSKGSDGRYEVRIPNKDGSILTSVQDGEFKETKQQETGV